ncbi:sugar phosphate isomerase/epimerase family protein [Devosia sediminis]|uniref:TIM barrel protein n=1 Tax=Devosia sediminis TaxID=2798801 RepID=A0A934IYB7_9HYPH|nr:TIM barrel protein [Devosia sediminis]MBJ3784978.1 TIM barrel protein [Devosia sediminis]
MTLALGLCSAALRHLDLQAVVDCAVAGGASGIEWEARRHVPSGNLASARTAARLSRAAGLCIPSYGTYVTAGAAGARQEFAGCLAAAELLDAPFLRVWTHRTIGLENQAGFDEMLDRVVSDLAVFCDQAESAGRTVSLEFHPGTFAHSATAALQLVDRVGRNTLLSHWQPDYGQPLDEAKASLQAMLPVLSHLHVFCWTKERVRLPLHEHRDYWAALLAMAGQAPDRGWPRYAMIEFSPSDLTEAVLDDLATLSAILPA